MKLKTGLVGAEQKENKREIDQRGDEEEEGEEEEEEIKGRD